MSKPDLPFGVEHADDLLLPFCACGRVHSECDGSRAGCKRPTVARPIEPTPGTYAFTARALAELDPGFDWDAWKDEMKDGEL